MHAATSSVLVAYAPSPARDAFVSQLRSDGADVAIAGDLSELARELDSGRVGVVVTDFLMTHIGTVDLLRTLQRARGVRMEIRQLPRPDAAG